VRQRQRIQRRRALREWLTTSADAEDRASFARTKKATDVTVIFLDIEGYTRLSEELPRPARNALVEHYFSLFLAPIRAEGGDINETAGDGLMIIFQASVPNVHATAAARVALAIKEQTTAASGRDSPADPRQYRHRIQRALFLPASP
jgi:class 3 adenylate cyclase